MEAIIFETSSSISVDWLIGELNRRTALQPPIRRHGLNKRLAIQTNLGGRTAIGPKEIHLWRDDNCNWWVGVYLNSTHFAISKSEPVILRAASTFAREMGKRSFLIPA